MRNPLSLLWLLLSLIFCANSSWAQRPHRLWSTYVGDGYNHFVSLPPCGTVISDIVYSKGYIYMAGTTTDTNFIATPGTHKPSNNPGDFIHTFVAKFDTMGQRVWGTYFGSTAPYVDDNTMFNNMTWEPYLALDQAGNIFLGGTTICPQGIATPGAFQPLRDGPYYSPDGYLAKFNNQGQRLWSTYFKEVIRGVACDGEGNVYAIGTTNQEDMGTPGTFKPAITVSLCDTYRTYDAFLVKFNGNGQRLWSTYYGGTGRDGFNAIVVAPNNDVLVAGSTSSNTGIATTGAYQTTISTSGCDASQRSFVARFNASGQRVWGTYFGDNPVLGTSIPLALQFAEGGNDFYIGGYTTEGTGMTTTGSFQPQHHGLGDGYLARLSGNGQQLIWGTFYGGAGMEFIQASSAGDAFVSGMNRARFSLALTADNDVLIAGVTNSTGMSTTCTYPAAQPNIGFMAKFTKDGVRKWGSYNDADAGASGLAAGSGSKFYLGVATLDAGKATPNAWKTSKGGAEQAGLLTAFSDDYTCPDIAVNISIEHDSVLHADPGFAHYEWFRNSISQPGDSSTFIAQDTGSYYVVVRDSCGCVYTSKTVRPNLQPTSILELKGVDLALFPNPNNGQFTIRGTIRNSVSGKAFVEIADITGRKVYDTELKVSNGVVESTIDLSRLLPGLYTIKVQSGKASGVYKMVKQ